MSVIDLDACAARFVDSIQYANLVIGITLHDLTTTDGGNLTATEYAVTDNAAPYCDFAVVYATVVIVTSTEDVSAVRKSVQSHMVRPRLIVQFLFILTGFCIVDIADVSVVHGQVRRTKHRTTLATGIGITLDGWNALVEAIAFG